MRKIIYAFCVAIFASVFILSCSGDEFFDDNSKTDLELGGSNSSVVNLNIPDQFKAKGGASGSIAAAVTLWLSK